MRLSQPSAAAGVKLTDNEAKVYTLIARQYLMQFCPDAVFRKCQIDLEIANGKFVAKARFLAEAGWRTLLGSKERDEENDGTPLPVVAKGDELLCERGEVVERQTQPPRHFTDATLLSAMTGIARFVQDKDLKKILRATDGLGTEATRAGIIELLFKRGFLSKKGRYIHSSEAGRALIHSPAGDGRATGHDRPLGVGVDADQRETVPLSGLYAAAGGDAVSTDRSGAQHAGASVPRPRWRRAGRRSRSAKVKGSRKAKKRQTIPRRRRSNPPVVARMRYPTATASPPVRPMVYTKQPGRASDAGPLSRGCPLRFS